MPSKQMDESPEQNSLSEENRVQQDTASGADGDEPTSEETLADTSTSDEDSQTEPNRSASKDSPHTSGTIEASSDDNGSDALPISTGESLFKHGWKVTAAKATGLSHRRHDTPCEDSFAFDVTADGILLAAVADGAGSRSRGGDGADIACETAINSMRNRLPSKIHGEDALTSILQTCAQDALEAIEFKASEENIDSKDFACTLLLIAATYNFVVGIQVGDGATIVRRVIPLENTEDVPEIAQEEPRKVIFSSPPQATDEIEQGSEDREEQSNDDPSPPAKLDDNPNDAVFTAPQQGQYANQTYFLTSPGRIDKAEANCLSGDIKGLILFSDGLQRMALDGHVPRSSFLDSLFLYLNRQVDGTKSHEGLEALLRSDKIQSRTHDDTTILVAIPVTENNELLHGDDGVKAENDVTSSEENVAVTSEPDKSQRSGCALPFLFFL